MDVFLLKYRILITLYITVYIRNSYPYQGSPSIGPSNQSEAYFNGSSYVRLQTTISLKKQTGLSFRTCIGGSLFSQQLNDDLIELSVNAEGLSLTVTTSGKHFEEKIRGKFLNNRWHTIDLQYKLGNLSLRIDQEKRLIANSSYNNELLTSPGLYNEGAAVLLIGKQFNGCLLEGPSIVFNPLIITSSHNVKFENCPLYDDSCTPREDAPTVDYCAIGPCIQGNCINGPTSYTCICKPRYTGKNCEIDMYPNSIPPCERVPPLCKNNGVCETDNRGEYTCHCSHGYTGRNCESEIIVDPLCINNPCLNKGTCEVTNTYDLNKVISCKCTDGFEGPLCEINIDECLTKPCKNGGICIDGFNNFTCDCTHTGYTGRICDVNINECLTNPCLNGGTCFNTYGSYVCQCPSGFDGINCQHPLNECISNPCFNNGDCIDLIGSYRCNCPAGFLGDRCQIEQRGGFCDSNTCPAYADCISKDNSFACICKSGFLGKFPNCTLDGACVPNPCRNGGICTPTKGGFECSCMPGFTDSECDSYACTSTCFNGGTCVLNKLCEEQCSCALGWFGSKCQYHLTCINKPCKHAKACYDYLGGYYCSCETGWAGLNCHIELNLCVNQPCHNQGTCIDHGDFFTCHCKNGFEGKYCHSNVDECQSIPCQNGGTCVDKINSFSCNCTDHWMGPLCEKPYDACEFRPCLNNATCISSSNKRDFTCMCPTGFDGPRCEININDCINVKCPQGQVCIDQVAGYECRCPEGYAGDDCTIDINPCSKGPCKNQGRCHVDPITYNYTCTCPPGFTGPNCGEDIDECKENATVCNNGVCFNNIGSFQCYCQPGFTGETCRLDFDECLSMPCRNNATCLNKINNFECVCPPGYTGHDCSININECEPQPCENGSTCIDGINEFTCICRPGLTGKQCEIDIDDCASSPCLNLAKCIDGFNSYTCDCTDIGYTGVHCEINIDDCIGDPCQNGGQCIDEVKDYQCNCFEGYAGKNCEVDINECESNPCKHDGTCLERSNDTLYLSNITSAWNITLPDVFSKPFDYSQASGYECLCVQGVLGKDCEINIDECESNPCVHGVCVDKVGGYICQCEEGYEGIQCNNDIDECKKYHPCVHGTCVDKKANYFCDCDPNFGGKNCSVKLTGCLDNPCLNNGSCKPYLVRENEHRFNCSCPNGFYGHTCEKVTTMSLTAHSLVTINTTREEGYDIQFRFKTTLGDGLLAVGKGVTYYILILSQGRLNLQSSLLNKWEGVFIGSNLNNSKWQKVFVAINSSHLVLSANEEQTIYPIFNEHNASHTSFPVTYIGGVPSNLRKFVHGQLYSVGCCEDVLINGEWILPDMRNASWLNIVNVDTGCIRQPQCDPNPCYSGGTCTDKWRDFSCICERPYLGNTCQYNYTAATFGYENITDSLVTVTVGDQAKRAVRTIVDISMFIKTRQSKGQIFYLGSALSPVGAANSMDETYIAAQLEGGELLVRIQFNGTPEAYTVGGVKLNDGYSHLIEVIRNVTLVQVKLNGTEYFRKTISTSGNLDAQVLFLGGTPQLRLVRQADNIAYVTKADAIPPSGPSAVTTPLSNIHFKGIIQDVQVSNGSYTMVVEFFPLQAENVVIPPSFGNVTFDKRVVLEGIRSDDLCRFQPCRRGACINTWNDYRCICPRGYKGKDCSEMEFCQLEQCPAGSQCRNLEDDYECVANATFTGEHTPLQYSYVIQNNSFSRLFDNLQITYRTRSWGTLFFAKQNEDYFVIFIYHNEVVVEGYLGGFFFNKRFRKDHFEGQWLTIIFKFKDGYMSGGFKDNVMDDNPNFEVTDFTYNAFLGVLLTGRVLVAGSDNKTFDFHNAIDKADFNSTGYISTSDTTTEVVGNSIESTDSYNEDVFLYKVDQNKTTDNFKGCIAEVRIGGLLLPFYTTKQLRPHASDAREYFELAPDTPADIGCILCYNADCYNEGHCINPVETYKCNCSAGYAADDCSIDINECENNQCQNNATCIDKIAQYECDCQPGYEGIHCETEINECLSNPCRHGGTCVDLVATFKCECPVDFVGKQCEAPLLITCDNKPCREGATCQPGANEKTGNNFTCICTEGMEGPLCDRAFCQQQRCENKGFCNVSGIIPLCECERGYEGRFCEINIDDCVSPAGVSPCQNGGQCIDGVNRYDCICEGTGYTGLLCEMDINECSQDPMPCGNGSCINTEGSYICNCSDPLKCGHQCILDDPCYIDNPCVNGECKSNCTNIPDYICTCFDNYTGKDCTEHMVTASANVNGFNILYVVIPLVLFVIVGLAIGMAVLVNVARSKRATRGTYSPSAQEFCNPRVELDHVLKPPPEERLI